MRPKRIVINVCDDTVQPAHPRRNTRAGHAIHRPRFEQATAWLMQRMAKQPNEAVAVSTDFMHLFGTVALG
jgi:hypothetical protein